MNPVYAALVAMSVVVLLLGLLVVGLLRSHAEILRKLESLGAGESESHHHENDLVAVSGTRRESLPDISGVNPDGEPIVVSMTNTEQPTLLAFLSTSCSSCSMFWESLDNSELYFGATKHRVLILTRGAEEESPSRALSLRRGHADVLMSSRAWDDFDVPGAPYFTLVTPDRGVVGEGSATTFAALEEFLSDSISDAKWDSRHLAQEADERREDRIDEELRRAGIEPGDPRLYPDSLPSEGDLP